MVFVTLSKVLALAGLGHGVYASFKTLRLKNRVAQAKAGANLLMFWTILSCLSIHEQFTEALVSWLPMYYVLKCGLLGGLILPQIKLPRWVFKRLLVPTVNASKTYFKASVWPRIGDRLSSIARVVHVGGVTMYLEHLDEQELHAWEADIQQLLVAVQAERSARRGPDAAAGDGNGNGDGAVDGGDVVTLVGGASATTPRDVHK